MQTIFKHGQLLALLCATSFEDSVQVRALGMIDADAIISDIHESLTTDKFAQEQIAMIHARSEGSTERPHRTPGTLGFQSRTFRLAPVQELNLHPRCQRPKALCVT
jgi:hypothetical protein